MILGFFCAPNFFSVYVYVLKVHKLLNTFAFLEFVLISCSILLLRPNFYSFFNFVRIYKCRRILGFCKGVFGNAITTFGIGIGEKFSLHNSEAKSFNSNSKASKFSLYNIQFQFQRFRLYNSKHRSCVG